MVISVHGHYIYNSDYNFTTYGMSFNYVILDKILMGANIYILKMSASQYNKAEKFYVGKIN